MASWEGLFDPLLNREAWFEDEYAADGLFDEDWIKAAGTGGLVINCIVGTAGASGFTAQVDLQYAVSGIIGTATASGFTANVDRQNSFTATIGTATASGITAQVDLQYQVSATVGTSTANGFDATISFPSGGVTINCTVGTATASGLAANIDKQLTIAGVIGAAVASGFTASIFEGAIINLALTQAQANRLEAICRLHGLIDPLVVSATGRGDGTVTQIITGTTALTVTTTGLPVAGLPTVAMLDNLARWYGLIDPMIEQDTSRSDGTLSQSVATVGGTTTVTLQ